MFKRRMDWRDWVTEMVKAIDRLSEVKPRPIQVKPIRVDYQAKAGALAKACLKHNRDACREALTTILLYFTPDAIEEAIRVARESGQPAEVALAYLLAYTRWLKDNEDHNIIFNTMLLALDLTPIKEGKFTTNQAINYITGLRFSQEDRWGWLRSLINPHW